MAQIENKNIIFDKSEIEKGINENEYNIFEKDSDMIFTNIIKENKKVDNLKYFAKIKRNNEEYIGILTEDFKRDLFGYSLFNQGDEYLGEISKENKNGFGIYKF